VTGATGPFDPSQMMGSAQLRIAISFRRRHRLNGGSTERRLAASSASAGAQATASAVERQATTWTLVFILLGVAAVAIVAAIVVLMNRRKRRPGVHGRRSPSRRRGHPIRRATAPMPPASMPPDAPEALRNRAADAADAPPPPAE
jgi:hypothetical protein